MLDLGLLAPEKPRPIKRSEFIELSKRGAFDDQRVELLYGVIVEMSPPDSPDHSSPIQVLTELLVPKLVGRAHVRVQLPYASDDESQPKPDFAIVPTGKYRDDHPKNAHRSRLFVLAQGSPAQRTAVRRVTGRRVLDYRREGSLLPRFP